MIPDLAWHRKKITKPMENGNVPDWLGLDRYGLDLARIPLGWMGCYETLQNQRKTHVRTFSAGTGGLALRSLRARVGSLCMSAWLDRRYGFQRPLKNTVKPMKNDTSGGCPNKGHQKVPRSLRARVGSLNMKALWIFADVPWALQTHMRRTLQAN